MGVKQLGYLIFDLAPDTRDGMRTIFGQLFEAPLADRPDGAALVRLDGRDFRIMLRNGAENKLAAIGWEVGSPAELDALAARLAAEGIACDALDPNLCEDRAVRSAIRFQDPDGFPLELFVDRPFARDTETAGKFVCGEESDGAFGLGHIVQICRDRAQSQRFYIDVLGFDLSDRIKWDAADLFFLHCNRRHHSIALSNEAFGLKAGMIDHFMIEARSKAQVDSAYEKLAGLGFKVSQTLGQHTNDEVYSFYMMAPTGFRVEFGYGGKTIGDPADWQVVEYDAPSSWGHELVHPE
ncbi:putative 2,3-dihydroxybiphenyl 1,2-dioxygenase [Sphingobium jiangsuense]|uniref:2,3-dihydroxybiphenyl 1,2-dioxygenase n=1 Tax=Sphingobium jiangsuense TaxID=870476 RepID=A0A7W6FQV0_9SPHN|nr:VOC family protein [Sphingobium jiangsuense]MBB3927057.1 2,3-dihydroxybiphenyl 1,2-dioxygenase [Sphingobium jiangsuense]GLT00277.1 putative 2,3-dihydroxybiphenyl 1,2-dioxygenase [Sphingobium jiangsuense]